MADPERNAPCPCGSGLKFKKCCLLKQWEAEGEKLAREGREREERMAEYRRERGGSGLGAAMLLAGACQPPPPMPRNVGRGRPGGRRGQGR